MLVVPRTGSGCQKCVCACLCVCVETVGEGVFVLLSLNFVLIQGHVCVSLTTIQQIDRGDSYQTDWLMPETL